MANQTQLKKLLLAEQEIMTQIASIELPDFTQGKELGNLIKSDENFSDSVTYTTIKRHGTLAADYLKRATGSAKKVLPALDEALARLNKKPSDEK